MLSGYVTKSRVNLRLKVLGFPLETASVGEYHRVDGEMWGTLFMFVEVCRLGFSPIFAGWDFGKTRKEWGRSQDFKN